MQFTKETIRRQGHIEFTGCLSFAFVVTGETIVQIGAFVVQSMTDLDEEEDDSVTSKARLTWR